MGLDENGFFREIAVHTKSRSTWQRIEWTAARPIITYIYIFLCLNYYQIAQLEPKHKIQWRLQCVCKQIENIFPFSVSTSAFVGFGFLHPETEKKEFLFFFC